ncbi:MAG: hypothetical protein KAJ33_05865, partial [Thermoplasmata archaeon]|nr:hypothetical protein [Thermoplasmata archaeon]
MAALFICMAFTVTISNNTKAEFVNTLAVPWGPSFTPIDSVWDSTGDHCIVVGNDTSDLQSSAWYYSDSSGIWYNITEGGDVNAVPGNYAKNVNSGLLYATIQEA